jgi:hypothetical protein
MVRRRLLRVGGVWVRGRLLKLEHRHRIHQLEPGMLRRD